MLSRSARKYSVIKHFRGSLYKLNELVLNVPSVIEALAAPHRQRIFKIDPQQLKIHQQNGEIQSLEITDQQITLTAQRYVLTAGEGSEAILQDWQIPQPQMQAPSITYGGRASQRRPAGFCSLHRQW